MPVVNVIDHRSNRYDVAIDVVFEPSFCDNSIPNATQFRWDDSFHVDSVQATTFEKAISYANKKFKGPVTMYIYDFGSKPLG
jgi:hypothetical protein